MAGTNKAVGQFLIIAGDPAAAKSAVVKQILARNKHYIKHFGRERFTKIVTYCDRPIRPGEVDGFDYHFLTPEKFEEYISSGEIMEHDYSGSSRKGTGRKALEDAIFGGQDVIWEITANRASLFEEFIEENWGGEIRQKVEKQLTRVYITVSNTKALVERYKIREKNPDVTEFKKRLNHERMILKKRKHRFPDVIHNDGPKETFKAVVDAVLEIADKKHHSYRRK